ncbi:hypothetical protein F4805DRAFT_56486 [Annulohypoxylon moriforme]|nr:hypothetical protein F4805DRAFT_56486 [Annulohypoxylon moriforme]
MSSMILIDLKESHVAFLALPHILSHLALLGISLYLSFAMMKVYSQSLPGAAFMTLPKRIFPTYFHVQILLLLLTAATIPPYGPLTLLESKANWIPFLIAGVAAILNMIIYGRRVHQIVTNRILQETRNEEKLSNPVELSDDIKAPTKSLSRNHAISIHLNLVLTGAMIWWTWKLAL